ncbi:MULTISPECIES: glycosyltransferase [unclassified Butyrivibrio]|uniref:glycosyltransferase n=1 Tax=unclassified Butyrivibrio TaxID=2639466 RepID=UPI0003B3FCDD|nr:MULTISPECIES: glycosyltransferase [unclassified Butyrivibrio]MDC7292971.1 glycosyltransferase [Butyrivibrio sp. DSM 10294]
MEYGYGQIRILHVLGGLGVGGAECRIMDLYRNMNRDKIQFDFLVHYSPEKTGKKSPTSDELMAVREPDYFDNSVKKLGGRIFCLPKFVGTNINEYKAAIKQFFKEHEGEWKVVQGHMTSTAAIYLPIAKKAGVPITIAHARSAGVDAGVKGLATKFFRSPLQKEGSTDWNFACSREAGYSVFGKNLMDIGSVRIIPNAIDLGHFAYDEEKRNVLRKELGVSNALVIGHVGSFRYAKNHEFLLTVFANVCRLLDNDDLNQYTILHGMRIRLLMLGKGPLMEDMKKLADKLHIADRCIFAGNKSNASDYYQAMDYFCFPSRYEGLPGSVVEAQAAGLQCLVSDSVTPEVNATELVSMMSINSEARDWARKIIDDLMLHEDYGSQPLMEEIKLNQTLTAITGERRESIFETDDTPDMDLLDKDTGFDTLNTMTEEERQEFAQMAIREKVPGNRMHRSIEYSIGDRSQSSKYIINKLRNAGFDVKLQARELEYFYEHGHF